MNPFTLLALAVFALVMSAAAVRLLWLSANTRKAPELLLGLSLSLPLSGYALMVAGALRAGGKPPPSLVEVGGGLIDAGFIGVVAFVWLVFRREETWAGLLGAALVLGGLSMPVVNHALPWSGGIPAVIWPRAILRTVSCGWAAFEALRYAGLMRRRVRFGLAEPLVADRFALWGLGYLCLAVMLGSFTAGAALHMRDASYADAFTVAGAALGVPASLAMGLSFFPPTSYVRWVERKFRPEGGA